MNEELRVSRPTLRRRMLGHSSEMVAMPLILLISFFLQTDQRTEIRRTSDSTVTMKLSRILLPETDKPDPSALRIFPHSGRGMDYELSVLCSMIKRRSYLHAQTELPGTKTFRDGPALNRFRSSVFIFFSKCIPVDPLPTDQNRGFVEDQTKHNPVVYAHITTGRSPPVRARRKAAIESRFRCVYNQRRRTSKCEWA